MAFLLVSSEFLPGRCQPASRLLLCQEPPNSPKGLLKNFLFIKNITGGSLPNNSEVSASVSIVEACSTVGTDTRLDPPVGLEVITNWPQNRSISLGLARKRVFVFVSSCNPSCDLFLILCLFLSLSFAILLLLGLSHHSPMSSD